MMVTNNENFIRISLHNKNKIVVLYNIKNTHDHRKRTYRTIFTKYRLL